MASFRGVYLDSSNSSNNPNRSWVTESDKCPQVGADFFQSTDSREHRPHVVHDYIQLTDATWRTLDEVITPLLNGDTLKLLPNQTFAEDEANLTNTQTSDETTVRVLSPLEQLNQRQIKLVQKVVSYAQAYKRSPNVSDWTAVRQLVEQYDSNWKTERSIVISILNTAHIPIR